MRFWPQDNSRTKERKPRPNPIKTINKEPWICSRTNAFGSADEESSSATRATLSISSAVHLSRSPASISRVNVALNLAVKSESFCIPKAT